MINNIADNLATNARQMDKVKTLDPVNHSIFLGQICAIKIVDEVIHKNLKKIIMEQCSKGKLRDYLREKFG